MSSFNTRQLKALGLSKAAAYRANSQWALFFCQCGNSPVLPCVLCETSYSKSIRRRGRNDSAIRSTGYSFKGSGSTSNTHGSLSICNSSTSSGAQICKQPGTYKDKIKSLKIVFTYSRIQNRALPGLKLAILLPSLPECWRVYPVPSLTDSV